MRLNAVPQQIIGEKLHICPKKLHILLKTMTQTQSETACADTLEIVWLFRIAAQKPNPIIINNNTI